VADHGGEIKVTSKDEKRVMGGKEIIERGKEGKEKGKR